MALVTGVRPASTRHDTARTSAADAAVTA
ncbi:MAG: hypothetical protein JWQ53_167, partial [Klenkia sp.]|nr:hypothetical protein [Klenkia sp.]